MANACDTRLTSNQDSLSSAVRTGNQQLVEWLREHVENVHTTTARPQI